MKNITDKEHKDIFYYISKAGSFISSIFWILFALLILLYAYIFIQQNEKMQNSQMLDPFCRVFLWDLEHTNAFCSSVSALHKEHEKKLKDLKNTQVWEIISILEELYKLENFLKTKEVIFLGEKTLSKLQILQILEEFDTLKNNFESIEKDKIQCSEIEINEENIFKAKCESFSAWYEWGIKWFDGSDISSVRWTSISIANSFLNYIEKNSDLFHIIDRQKIFSAQSIIWEKSWFTSKTTFYLKLQYSPNNLSL